MNRTSKRTLWTLCGIFGSTILGGIVGGLIMFGQMRSDLAWLRVNAEMQRIQAEDERAAILAKIDRHIDYHMTTD